MAPCFPEGRVHDRVARSLTSRDTNSSPLRILLDSCHRAQPNHQIRPVHWLRQDRLLQTSDRLDAIPQVSPIPATRERHVPEMNNRPIPKTHSESGSMTLNLSTGSGQTRGVAGLRGHDPTTDGSGAALSGAYFCSCSRFGVPVCVCLDLP